MTHSPSRRTDPRRVLASVLLLAGTLAGAVLAGRWLRSDRADMAASPPASPPTDAAPSGSAQAQAPNLNAGALLYATTCMKCHGPEGHGDPESVAQLRPPPRDFAGSSWRFPRTPESIARVIREGIPDTAMPASPTLSADQVAALVEHVQQLAGPTGGRSTAETEIGKLLQAAGFSVMATPYAAPDLQLQSPDGSSLSLADFRGRLVLLSFWGTYCEPCLAEMPHLRDLQREFGDAGLSVVSVCADEPDLATISKIAAETAPGHTVYADADGLGSPRYQVSALPVCFLIDRAGNVIARQNGAVDWHSHSTRLLLRGLLGTELPQDR